MNEREKLAKFISDATGDPCDADDILHIKRVNEQASCSPNQSVVQGRSDARPGPNNRGRSGYDVSFLVDTDFKTPRNTGASLIVLAVLLAIIDPPPAKEIAIAMLVICGLLELCQAKKNSIAASLMDNDSAVP